MRILLTGANGQLGAYLRAPDIVPWTSPRSGGVDLTDMEAVRHAFMAVRPDVVIHAAAKARVSDCHRDPDLARRVNVDATATLADLAAQHGSRLVFVSTDLVFDGEHAPYREDALPTPLSIYGHTKAEAERIVLNGARNAVVRLSLLFGPSRNGRPSFFDEQIASVSSGRPVTLFVDEWRTPLDLDSAAQALLAVARSDFAGILHVGGSERMTRANMGRRLAQALGSDGSGIQGVRREDVPAPEPRPRDTSLDSSRCQALFPGLSWPSYETALWRLLCP